MKKVVLVGKNIFFLAQISDQLTRLGHSASIVSSAEGVNTMAMLGASLIIFDLATQGVDVLEMIKKLKGTPKTSSIPLIGFCGHKEEKLLEAARSCGCDLVTTNGTITSQLPALLEKIYEK